MLDCCRELEKKYDLTIDPGIEEAKQKNKTKKYVKAATIEAQTGQQSFFNYVVSRKGKILEAIGQADSWENVHKTFLSMGMELKPRLNGLAIKDRFGRHLVKPSDIDRSLSKPQLEKIFGPFVEASKKLIDDVHTDDRYLAEPLHQHDQGGSLFSLFQSEMKQRKAALEAIKDQEAKLYAETKKQWAKKMDMVEKYAMLPAHRTQLLNILKANEQAEITANRLILSEQRKQIRTSMPYTSWTKFLQHKAAQGNEIALEVLRSKKVQPGPGPSRYDDKYESDMQRSLESKSRQIAVLNRKDINRRHQKALISVIKMQELFAKEMGLHVDDIGDELNYMIDTKGTVIFKFKTGGTIRDTGTELHLSAHDDIARKLGAKFASIKWGNRVLLSNENTLRFDTSTRPNAMIR